VQLQEIFFCWVEEKRKENRKKRDENFLTVASSYNADNDNFWSIDFHLFYLIYNYYFSRILIFLIFCAIWSERILYVPLFEAAILGGTCRWLHRIGAHLINKFACGSHFGACNRRVRHQQHFPAASLIAYVILNASRQLKWIALWTLPEELEMELEMIMVIVMVVLLVVVVVQLPLSGCWLLQSLFFGGSCRWVQCDPQSMLKFHCIFARWLNNFFQLIFMPCHRVCHRLPPYTHTQAHTKFLSDANDKKRTNKQKSKRGVVGNLRYFVKSKPIFKRNIIWIYKLIPHFFTVFIYLYKVVKKRTAAIRKGWMGNTGDALQVIVR